VTGVQTCALPIFQGPPWVVEKAYDARPFADTYDLRKAFDTVIFEAPDDQQLALIRSYPDLARIPLQRGGEGAALSLSVVDQAAAGLDRLNNDEHQTFDELTHAYRERFGFPLVIAVRENTKETILRQGNSRLDNPPGVEKATALVEIVKIANLRLLDRVEEPTSRPADVP